MVIRFLSLAEQDLVEASDWYRAQRRGLEREFSEAVRDTLNKLAEDPAAHGIAGGKIHRRRVQRFPYDVLFVMDHDEVLVVAVMHHHRHPARWRERWLP